MARILIVSLGVLAALLMVSPGAYADDPTLYTCSIDEVGVKDTSENVVVKLTDTDYAFDTKWFGIDSSRLNENRALAVVLTALSMGKNVKVRVTQITGTVNTDLIFRIYLSN